jgi:23S rRNA pseudouridine1911/1915/1917 synthase
MIVARTDAAHAWLAAEFAERRARKRYEALAFGHLAPADGAIDAPLGRDPRNRQRMAILPRGRDALTEYRVRQHLERAAGGAGAAPVRLSQLDAWPKTGRTHQIRVHLASIGHPIAGDVLYGQPLAGLDRQFLHAAELTITLPSGETRSFSAPLPDDLEAVLRTLSPAHDD